jgi:hypothetical protein
MELKEGVGVAVQKSETLLAEFRESFHDIQATFHPTRLIGELAGKCHNLTFAAHHVIRMHESELKPGVGPCNIVVTVIDGKQVNSSSI